VAKIRHFAIFLKKKEGNPTNMVQGTFFLNRHISRNSFLKLPKKWEHLAQISSFLL